jgi:hypothetical protein
MAAPPPRDPAATSSSSGLLDTTQPAAAAAAAETIPAAGTVAAAGPAQAAAAGGGDVDAWAALHASMAPLRVPGAPSAETDPLVGRVVAAMESANQHLTRCVQALDLSTGERDSRKPPSFFPLQNVKCAFAKTGSGQTWFRKVEHKRDDRVVLNFVSFVGCAHQ